MIQPRKVSFGTKFRLAKQKPIQLRLLIFLILFPLFFVFATYMSSYSYRNDGIPEVDVEEINGKGQSVKGVVKNIELSNIIDNNEHPTIITYSYLTSNGEIESKFQTLIRNNNGQISVGDTVEIKYLENESVIAGLESYSFPFYILYLAPLPILIIGVLFAIYFIITLNKQIKLYRYGEIRDAEIVSFLPKSGYPFSIFGEKVRIQYQYKIAGGNTITGESSTKDLSITKEKKPGDAIKIFVSPDNEFVTCLISKVDVKKNDWKI